MELGNRKEIAQISGPSRIKSLRDHELVQIASAKANSGQAVTLALTAAGQVLSFGSSSRGALGHGPGVTQTGPLLLRMTLDLPVKYVAAGAHHSVIVTDEGRVFAFGDNTFGQLGIGKRKPTVHSLDLPEPLNNFFMRYGPVKLLAAGDNHNVAVCDSGKMYSWGANSNGQLGQGHLKDQAEPAIIVGLQDGITSLTCGSRHSVALVRYGTQVFAWGSNANGQLGIGPNCQADGQVRMVPALVQTLSDKRGMEIVQVAAASCHSLAITRKGQVYAWGENSHGQLGFLPDTSKQIAAVRDSLQSPTQHTRDRDQPRRHTHGVDRLWKPERINSISNYTVRAVSTGEMHSLILAV